MHSSQGVVRAAASVSTLTATVGNDCTVTIATLTNARGIEVQFMNYGGVILSIKTPDRLGNFADIVLGYEGITDYAHDPIYFGALVGRNANRIAHGRFTVDGKTYQLSCNDGVNHLHGGNMGFSSRVWDLETFEQDGAVGAELSLMSADGDDGYPGTVTATVRYTLTSADELVVSYRATSDAATPVNLTQHSYFNLSGGASANVLDHDLFLDASRFTPINGSFIPTGELRAVQGTPFDFTSSKRIGEHLFDRDGQLQLGRGYDHNYVLNATSSTMPCARLSHAESGRTLELFTTEPGMQLFTGNTLDTVQHGKDGTPYVRHAGVALETQHFPDAPNQPTFPSTILRPGEVYASQTVYRFGVAS